MTKTTLLASAAATLLATVLTGCDSPKSDAAGGGSSQPTATAAATAKPTATATAAAASSGDISCEQMFEKLEKLMKASGAPPTSPDDHKKEIDECHAGKDRAPAEFKAAAECVMKLDEAKPDLQTCDALMEKLDKATTSPK